MSKKKTPGRPRKPKREKYATPLACFRLPPASREELEALREHLQIKSRTAIVILAIRRMARAELGTLPGDRSKANVKGKR